MSIESVAKNLGIDLEGDLEFKLHKEKRYTVIVHLLRKNGNTYVGSNFIPDRDFKRAKKLAFKNLENKIRKVYKTDTISLKCLEQEWVDVPIDTVIKGSIFEMQPVSNKWLTPEELEALVCTKNTARNNINSII